MAETSKHGKHLSLEEFMSRHADLLMESDVYRVSDRLRDPDIPPMSVDDISDPESPGMKARLAVFAQFNDDDVLFHRLEDWWLVKALKFAKIESPIAFRELLGIFLRRLDLCPTDNVFLRKGGKRGRPITFESSSVLHQWLTLGKPKPHRLAIELYGEKYTEKSRAEQKRVRNRLTLYIKRNAASQKTAWTAREMQCVIDSVAYSVRRRK